MHRRRGGREVLRRDMLRRDVELLPRRLSRVQLDRRKNPWGMLPEMPTAWPERRPAMVRKPWHSNCWPIRFLSSCYVTNNVNGFFNRWLDWSLVNQILSYNQGVLHQILSYNQGVLNQILSYNQGVLNQILSFNQGVLNQILPLNNGELGNGRGRSGFWTHKWWGSCRQGLNTHSNRDKNQQNVLKISHTERHISDHCL